MRFLLRPGETDIIDNSVVNSNHHHRCHRKSARENSFSSQFTKKCIHAAWSQIYCKLMLATETVML